MQMTDNEIPFASQPTNYDMHNIGTINIRVSVGVLPAELKQRIKISSGQHRSKENQKSYMAQLSHNQPFLSVFHVY